MRTLTTAQSQVVTNQVRHTAARFRCRDAVTPTTLAAGSSGATAPATLNVASTAGFAFQGTGNCKLSNGGYGVFTWTGKSGTTFTGCTWNTTTTLGATGVAVASTPDYTFIGGANAVAQQNWLKDISRTENIDSYMATATIHIVRDNYAQSTAPLMTQSVINNNGPALALHRECWIETAVLPMNGIAPVATDWIMVFHGFTDTVDAANDPITITASDLCGELQKTQMELAYDYGIWDPGHTLIVGYRAQAAGQSAVPPADNTFAYWFEVTTAGTTQGGPWKPNTAVISTGGGGIGGLGAIGDVVSPTVLASGGQQTYWKCTTGGTTGATEPNWSAFSTSNPTVTDNGVVWTQMNIDAAAGTAAIPDPLTTYLAGANPGGTGTGDGQTIPEFGSSTLVWTLRIPRARATSHAYTAGQVIVTTNGNLTQYWVCVVGGTSTSTASTAGFPLTPTLGQVVTDNTASGGSLSLVQWSAMGTPGGNLAEVVIKQLLNDFNARISMTLVVVPNGSQPNTGFYFGPYRQQQEDVLSAVTALALQVGYDLRMLWNASIGDFSLTMSYVKRPQTTQLASASAGASLPVGTLTVANTNGFASSGTLTVPTTTGISSITYSGLTATTFTGCSGGSGTLGVVSSRVVAVPVVSPSETYAAYYYKDIQTLKQDISLIRNRGGLTYTDNSYINGLASSYDLTVNSTPQRKYITDSDPQSSQQSAYGPLYFAVSEGSTLQTDNPTSALAFLDAIISDLSQPVLNQTVLMKYQPQTQINDQVKMLANFVHYDTDQTEAIVSQTDNISAKAATTTLGLRGNPTAGFRKYHNKAVAQGNVPVPVIKPQPQPTGQLAIGTFAGGVLTFNVPMKPALNWQYTEVHLSTVSGFIPSAATLATGGIAFSGAFTPQGLPPGVKHYCRLVHRFKFNTASYQPTPQFSFFTLGQSLVYGITSNTVAAATSGTGGENFTTPQPIPLGTKLSDPGGVFNTSTSTWTPTVPGRYLLNLQVSFSWGTGNTRAESIQIGVLSSIAGNYFSLVVPGAAGGGAFGPVTVAMQPLMFNVTQSQINGGFNVVMNVNIAGGNLTGAPAVGTFQTATGGTSYGATSVSGTQLSIVQILDS